MFSFHLIALVVNSDASQTENNTATVAINCVAYDANTLPPGATSHTLQVTGVLNLLY